MKRVFLGMWIGGFAGAIPIVAYLSTGSLTLSIVTAFVVCYMLDGLLR